MTRALIALLLMATLCLTLTTGCEEKPTAPVGGTSTGAQSVNKDAQKAARHAAEDGAVDDEDSADEADDADDADAEEMNDDTEDADADEDEAEAVSPPKCPVSGHEADADFTTVYKGKTYTFCCEDCIEAFAKNPEKFAGK